MTLTREGGNGQNDLIFWAVNGRGGPVEKLYRKLRTQTPGGKGQGRRPTKTPTFRRRYELTLFDAALVAEGCKALPRFQTI